MARVRDRSVLGGFTRGRAGSAAHRITVTGVAVVGTVHELPPGKLRRLRKREQRGIGR